MERLTIEELIDISEKECKEQENTIKYLEEMKEFGYYIAPHRAAKKECEQIAEYLKELKKYKDLEEQGLLLRLPTEAYFIKDNKVHKGWVQELVYSPCRKLLLDIRYDDNTLDSYRGYVGNTVFLTKEEAEQKLMEMESD